MSQRIWYQKEVETIVEIALWAGDNHFPSEDNEAAADEVDQAGGISQWIRDRAAEFEELHRDTDWSVTDEFYEDVEAWITAYVVAQRLG